MRGLLHWVWASYEALALWQWVTVVVPGSGGWFVVAAFTDWGQALSAGGVALVWLTIWAGLTRLFKRGAASGQRLDGSPGAQQATVQGSSAQSTGGHAIVSGDNSPITIETEQPAPTVLSPTFEGLLRGNSILMVIRNTDSRPHRFRARHHKIEGVGPETKPQKWLPQWICDWEVAGANGVGEIEIAVASGDHKQKGRQIKFCSNDVRMAPKFWGYAPFGGSIRMEIEIQSEDGMDDAGTYWWVLSVDGSGKPTSLTVEP